MSMPLETETLWMLGAAALVLVLVFVFYKPRGLRFHARGELLTKGELPFYRTLKAAAEDYDVCPKVRVADVINCDHGTWKRGGWRVGTWHLDFVLIDPRSGAVRLCIELDDASHARRDRRARDAFLNKAMQRAGVALLRLPHRRYRRAELRALLDEARERA
jgi:hypothetical protein